jgi:hypothetical protein
MTVMSMTIAAATFVASCAIAVLFQLALALGAPWGEYTMGGRFPGKLPPKMRAAAVIQIVVLFVMASIVLIRSGLALSRFNSIGKTGIWFVIAFFILGSILNLSTPGKGERAIWGPVNILLLITSIFVALSP